MLLAGVIGILLYISSMSTAQVDLTTCGSKNSDITCAFFFEKVDQAFRHRDVLYTLRKSFFPTEGARPILFDIFMTLEIGSVPDIMCSDEEYLFGDRPVSNPPEITDVCADYNCTLLTLEWKHQWSKTIITYMIEREDLELLQDTNFVALATATFNSFDKSVFSDDGENLQKDMSSGLTPTSLGHAGKNIARFLLNVDFLPCRPDDGILLEAWEDILPWV